MVAPGRGLASLRPSSVLDPLNSLTSLLLGPSEALFVPPVSSCGHGFPSPTHALARFYIHPTLPALFAVVPILF